MGDISRKADGRQSFAPEFKGGMTRRPLRVVAEEFPLPNSSQSSTEAKAT